MAEGRPADVRVRLTQVLPVLDWAARYDRSTLSADLVAAAIVTVMLIPQSLAYAMLAGLPPEYGLYASILPLAVYALFGTSSALSVGPVAVISLMTATALSQVAQPGSPEYIAAAATLALMSGVMLLVMGVLRLGLLTNFISHPVVSGFISASAILIAIGQARHLLGVEASGHDALELLRSLVANAGNLEPATLAVGGTTLLFLFGARRVLPLLVRAGFGEHGAGLTIRVAPAIAVVAATLATWFFDLRMLGVATVGDVPVGLPPLVLPGLDLDMAQALLPSAALISLIGFVESASVAQTLAARRRQSIRPNSELVALGMSNAASAFSAGFPVTGGFSRSVVNFDAGARTPAAGAMTAVGIAVVSLFLAPLLFHLPIAVLAGTIIVAVLSLIDLEAIGRTWAYSKADFAAMAVTIALTLLDGVETGVGAGVLLSLLLHLWRTSHPHIAVVGQVPGTQHYRNVLRHQVICCPAVLTIRVDGSLYFANARAVEIFVQDEIARQPSVRHVVLQMSAVNFIDASALESLERIMHRLQASDIDLHLSEVKGPVADRLGPTAFLRHLTGRVFLSQHEAMYALDPDFGSRPAVRGSV